jgi:NAD(P)-dependent dehydrogenase (short-subunit alcohol dehydrogenase family)
MTNMKRVLLIGGSRGLGLGLVTELLERGWDVTTTVRNNSEELTRLQARVGDHLAIETLDITDQKQAAELAQRLSGQTYDLLYLNAGILVGRQTPLPDISDDDINAIFLTNAISPIRVADRLLDNVAAGGMVAFVSSILGSIGTNEDGRAELYRASKAALNSLVRSFRARHADRDVTVLALHPGVVRTAMGGPNAPLDVDTSVKGVADVIEQRWGSGGQAFVDYRNEIVPW